MPPDIASLSPEQGLTRESAQFLKSAVYYIVANASYHQLRDDQVIAIQRQANAYGHRHVVTADGSSYLAAVSGEIIERIETEQNMKLFIKPDPGYEIPMVHELPGNASAPTTEGQTEGDASVCLTLRKGSRHF